eukprot:g24194.t1
MAISCIPFGAGEINCALTLLCQMIGNLVAMIAALQMVMTSPYENVAGVDKNAMMSFATNVIYSRIVAGMCVTMIFGNCYYAWMAWRMMRREKTTNVCCLPYGINTPAAFAFIFSVVAKAAKEAAATGMSWEEGVLYAWRVGCVANLVSGIIATLCGFAGPLIVKVAPPGSLMVALAGLGFTYLGIGQIISCFDVGHLGLLPLGVALVGFFGEVKTSPFPAAVAVMLVGSLTGWLSFEGWPEGGIPTGQAFGLSSCAFMIGYLTLAALFVILKILQAYGFSRVPPPIKDTLEDGDAEHEAEEVARRANERPSSRIISTFFENGVVPPADLDPSESSESAEDEDQELVALKGIPVREADAPDFLSAAILDLSLVPAEPADLEEVVEEEKEQEDNPSDLEQMEMERAEKEDADLELLLMTEDEKEISEELPRHKRIKTFMHRDAYQTLARHNLTDIPTSVTGICIGLFFVEKQVTGVTQETADSLNYWDAVHILQSFTEASVANESLLLCLAEALSAKTSKMATKHVLDLLAVYEAADLRPRALYVELLHSIVRLSRSMYAEEVALTLQALARYNIGNPTVIAQLMRTVASEIKEFRLRYLCATTGALGVLRACPPELLKMLNQRARFEVDTINEFMARVAKFRTAEDVDQLVDPFEGLLFLHSRNKLDAGYLRALCQWSLKGVHRPNVRSERRPTSKQLVMLYDFCFEHGIEEEPALQDTLAYFIESGGGIWPERYAEPLRYKKKRKYIRTDDPLKDVELPPLDEDGVVVAEEVKTSRAESIYGEEWESRKPLREPQSRGFARQEAFGPIATVGRS